MEIPPRVESVYSLTQHVWAGTSDSERRESKRQNRVRLDTLDEFFVDPVRSYLHRILEAVGEGKGQGFWLQAEFGVGKSHLLAAKIVRQEGVKTVPSADARALLGFATFLRSPGVVAALGKVNKPSSGITAIVDRVSA